MVGGGGVAVAVGVGSGASKRPSSRGRKEPRNLKGRTSDPQDWVTSHVLASTSGRPSFSRSMSCTEGKCFRWAMAATILLNVIQLGLAVEVKGKPWSKVWEVAEHFFVAAFVLEMVLKVHENGCDYFRNNWNKLDCFIAVTGVLETWVLRVIMSGSDDSNIPVFSIIRVLRLLRMIRMLRMKRELDVLLEGMIASFRSMVWVGLLLAVAIYSFAIFCTSTIGDPRETELYAKFGLDNRKYFGSILRSSLSLFNIVLLNDWSLVVWPVFNAQPYATIFLIIFVILTSCGMLNVIIGVIVERTNEATNRLREEDLENMRKDQMMHAEKLAVIMDLLDTDKDSFLTEQELMAAAENSDFGQTLREGMLNGMNLPLNFEFTDLYLMLDQDSNNKLSPKEFIEGMYRLVYGTEFQHTCMMQLSMAKLMREFKVMESTFKRDMYRCCDEIMQEVHSLRRQVLVGDVSGIEHPPAPLRRDVSSSSCCFSKPIGSYLETSKTPTPNSSPPEKRNFPSSESTPSTPFAALAAASSALATVPSEFLVDTGKNQVRGGGLCGHGARREVGLQDAATASSRSHRNGSTTFLEVKTVEPLASCPEEWKSCASASTTAVISAAGSEQKAKELTEASGQGENTSLHGTPLNEYVHLPSDSDGARYVV